MSTGSVRLDANWLKKSASQQASIKLPAATVAWPCRSGVGIIGAHVVQPIRPVFSAAPAAAPPPTVQITGDRRGGRRKDVSAPAGNEAEKSNSTKWKCLNYYLCALLAAGLLLMVWQLVRVAIDPGESHVHAAPRATLAPLAAKSTDSAATPSLPSPPPPSLLPPSPPPRQLPHARTGPVKRRELKITECVHVIGGMPVSFAKNRVCDDGGDGATSNLCALGHDWPDCPARYVEI